MCSDEILFIQFGVKENHATCRFIFFDGRNSFNSLSTERSFFRPKELIFQPKDLETVQF
jgi:hypothetical protein